MNDEDKRDKPGVRQAFFRGASGNGITERAVWHVVKDYARRLGLIQVTPHDLRRSCAKLCHAAGGELEQIQFLLGHVSVQTTE